MSRRDARIDFFRGLALLMIFVDHVYYNRLGGYTLRGYGIADAGEVFFFLSGYVATLAYERIFATQGYLPAQRSSLLRCVRIYLAHALSFVSVVLITVILSDTEGFDEVFSVYRMSDIAGGDWSTALYGLGMLHQPFLFGILPVYVILSALTPAMLLLLRRSPAVLLLLSFSLYLAVQLFDINLKTCPTGADWAFNPLAYQFIFVLGMFFGWNSQTGRFPVRFTARSMALACVLLLLAFLAHKFIPFLYKHFVPELSAYAAGIGMSGKQNIEPMRIVHFLVLAYFVTGLLHWAAGFKPAVRAAIAGLARPVVRCGRHSLAVFACSIVLSYLGSFVIAAQGDRAMVWMPVNIVGIALLTLIAGALDRRREEAG